MNGFFETSAFFGVFISLLFYGIGMTVKKKLKLAVFNPLLIAIVLTILFLAVTGIDYSVYEKGAKHISFLLTPATICLAVPHIPLGIVIIRILYIITILIDFPFPQRLIYVIAPVSNHISLDPIIF